MNNLVLSNIKKKYHNKTVIENASFSITDGLYILHGINGSGKSTLIKIITGLIYKTKGIIKNDLEMSYLPDKYTFPTLIKTSKYLNLVLNLSKTEILSLLNKYQIPDIRINELSKGNYQKLGILQILNNESNMYILDEPLDGLDDFAKKLIKEEIKQLLLRGKIVILSLHNKTLFNELNPTILEVKDGFINEKKKKI